MKLNVLLFGVTKEIIGESPQQIEIQGETVKDLRDHLLNNYSKLSGLNSLMIAVNNEYAENDLQLKESDEIALIPPVSGG
ncbi:molybdopterin converting factor subunit 1 [Fulvivirga lutea]|uniref:Molybdopterin synthase sulfur carrier subunit n=1 Tax=Fulvivirga lutea TaxID=2810512 RepID=A0A974WEB4_9BACT|nr:molybdopterin converting factor subunit 1 [Fulvivirga lutea]QSE96004.1 molybdopterin converting factor subunit 1 [Fulvivirga lutea]